MTELRQRMIRDMTVRGFSPHTREAYIAAARGLAKHYRRSPDQLPADELQTYLVHMISEAHVRRLTAGRTSRGSPTGWSILESGPGAFLASAEVEWDPPREVSRDVESLLESDTD